MNDFNKFLKNELNEEQRRATKQKKGATLVVAGAGSGKTRVITSRMAHLILNEKIDPKSILALTFTNKAAGEMRERLTIFLKGKHSLPFVGTFHSYCLLLLKTNPQIIPFPTFSIIDSDDQQSLIKKILKRNNLEKQFSASALQYQFSSIKNKLQLETFGEFVQPIIKEVYLEYESEKSKARCLDFDDLMLQVLYAFKKNKEFKEKHQQRVRNILVDEYQDTNKVQHELLKNMALDEQNKFVINTICAVGDEDQSIYSWRGAVVTNMIKFQDDFRPAKLIKIEQNYRSANPILQAANAVIANNKIRHPKNLWSSKKAKNRILALNCKSDYQETDAIATTIKSLPKDKSLNNVAIIYRTHFQSRLIEESFIRNSITYNIVGGIRFYERKEIKDLLAYLRLVVNPFDKASLIRIINTPTRGLGAKFEEELFIEWNKNNFFDFKQILTFMMQKQKNIKAQSIKDFLNIFSSLKREQKTSHVIDKILERTGYLSFLKKAYDSSEGDTKSQNIEEFLRSIIFFENGENKVNSQDPFYRQNVDKNLETFLHEISLMQENLQKTKNKLDEDEQDNGQVQMMTLHAAKGLEFDTVIICGLEEGLLPSSRSMNTNQELEEERRLFYVGITRAKERLVLTHANYRNTYGQITDQLISRFLTEIPSKLLQHLDITKTHPLQIQTVISNWFGTKKAHGKLLTFNTNAKAKKIITAKSKTKSKFFTSSSWKKNQAVTHSKFGPGLVTKIEKKKDEIYHLTVLFKSGQKKVLSNFVKRI